MELKKVYSVMLGVLGNSDKKVALNWKALAVFKYHYFFFFLSEEL